MENVSSRCGNRDSAPRLRFPEFRGEWIEKKLGEIFFEVNERKHPELPVLSIQQGIGTVFRDISERRIAYDKANINAYKVIEPGDFIIHLRSFEGGLECSKHKGISSPAYKILRSNCIDSAAFKDYFRSYNFIEGKLAAAVTGIRDGKNIDMPTFWSLKINIPSLPEQKKIAAFFKLLDRRIQKQRQLVEFLKTYKRGYFRYLLSTFTTKEYLLNDIIFEYTEKATSNRQYPILSSTMNGIKLQTTYFNKYAASENTIGYKIVPYGYFTYRSMSDTGEFHFNYQDIIDKGIVSPAYPVFCVSEFHNSRFVEYILNETDFIKSQLMIAKEGGTRYALSFPKFQRLRIQLPDKFIQDKVAEQIVLFERKISSEEKVLLSFEVQKKHLLQQMFI